MTWDTFQKYFQSNLVKKKVYFVMSGYQTYGRVFCLVDAFYGRCCLLDIYSAFRYTPAISSQDDFPSLVLM